VTTYVHNNAYKKARLPECFERNAEGMNGPISRASHIMPRPDICAQQRVQEGRAARVLWAER
jgi:hypothetical protein